MTTNAAQAAVVNAAGDAAPDTAAGRRAKSHCMYLPSSSFLCCSLQQFSVICKHLRTAKVNSGHNEDDENNYKKCASTLCQLKPRQLLHNCMKNRT